MATRTEWTGTASELLGALAEAAGERGKAAFQRAQRLGVGGEVVDEYDLTARPQHPPDLGHSRAADARRQLVKQIDAGDDIEFRVGKGHRLGHLLDKPSARPRRELSAGDGEVMRRQVETGNMEPWVIRLYLAEKSPGSAGDVEQPRRAPPGDRVPEDGVSGESTF